MNTSERKQEMKRKIDEWQSRWNECSNVGKWTKRLIPRLEAWNKSARRAPIYWVSGFCRYVGPYGRTPTGQERAKMTGVYCSMMETSWG